MRIREKQIQELTKGIRLPTSKERHDLFLQNIKEVAEQGNINVDNSKIEDLHSWYDSAVEWWITGNIKEIKDTFYERGESDLNEVEISQIRNELKAEYLKNPPDYVSIKNYLFTDVFKFQYESLHDKVFSEVEDFKKYLLTRPGTEILDNAHRCVYKEEIAFGLSSFEEYNKNIDESVKSELMNTDYLTDKIYDIYLDSDISVSGAISEFIEELQNTKCFPEPAAIKEKEICGKEDKTM